MTRWRLLSVGLSSLLISCSAILGIGELPSAVDDVQDSSSSQSADGATTDAPSTDSNITHEAGSPDADAVADARCVPPYCEDFESYPTTALTNGGTVGPWSITIGGSGGGYLGKIDKVGIDGGMGFYAIVPNTSSGHVLLNYSADASISSNEKLFGRALVQLHNVNVGGNLPSQHLIFFQATAPLVDGGSFVINQGSNGNSFVVTEILVDGFANENSGNAGTFTSDAWHCMQWEYDGTVGGPATNEVTVWVDGTREMFSTAGWTLNNPWTAFTIGLNDLTATTTGVAIFLDDFALGDAPIACP